MKEIKTKPEAGKPKLLENAAKAPKTAMKDLWLKSKDKSISELKETPFASQRGEASNAPANNAGDQMLSGVETTAKKGADLTYRGGKKLAQTTARRVKERREISRTLSEAKNAGGKAGEAAKNTASKIRTKNTAAKAIKGKPQKAVKTASRSVKGVKQSAKGVKTAQQTAKTAQQAAKAAQKSAQATAKAAKAAAQAAKAAAKAAVTGLKAAVKAAATAMKAAAAAVKGLIALIAAGGWVAVVIILFICLIGLIVGSCFGIFFSGEGSGSGQTMQTAVQEINTDYQNKLEEIKASHTYDVLEMSGSRAVWKEVLAVYAVKTTTDTNNAQEVATIDDIKKQLLKDIFWQMNVVSSSTDTKTETVIVESDDGHGNIVETETTVTQTYLCIIVSHKTADEMAKQYGFSDEQCKQLAELLADENNSLWSQVLYGITGDNELVTVALSQVGNVGGEPYWSWYGFEGRVEWCACFVSWCADQCGYLDAGIIPRFSGVDSQGVPWFQERGQFQDASYTPAPGDIIFFDWEQDGSADHVGIVESVTDGRVNTIEGNSSDECRRMGYLLGSSVIYGYGIPTY